MIEDCATSVISGLFSFLFYYKTINLITLNNNHTVYPIYIYDYMIFM